MIKEHKVLIVGGGIAGLALAAFLKRKKVECEILEKESKWYPGYSIGIWYNGYKMVEKLGFGKEFKSLGLNIDQYNIVDNDGEIRMLNSFNEVYKKYEPAYTQILREELHSILLKASEGVKIRMNCSVESMHQIENGIEALCTDGSKNIYSLVVGADGINSKIRNMTFGEGFIDYSNWRAWYFWLDSDVSFPQSVIEVSDKGRFFIAFPGKDKKWAGFLALPMKHELSEDKRKRQQHIVNCFKGCGVVEQLLNGAIDFKELRSSDLAHVSLEQEYKGNIVLLGDAAHAFEPFGGLGTSMAMEDAFVLAEEIEKYGLNNVSNTLQHYAHRRNKRVRMAKKINREFWEFSRNNSRVQIALRNLAVKFFNKKLQEHILSEFEYFFKNHP